MIEQVKQTKFECPSSFFNRVAHSTDVQLEFQGKRHSEPVHVIRFHGQEAPRLQLNGCYLEFWVTFIIRF